MRTTASPTPRPIEKAVEWEGGVSGVTVELRYGIFGPTNTPDGEPVNCFLSVSPRIFREMKESYQPWHTRVKFSSYKRLEPKDLLPQYRLGQGVNMS